MKNKNRSLLLTACACMFILIAGFRQDASESSLEGAWHMRNGNTEAVLIYKDGYFVHTMFNKGDKKFIFSSGGTYKAKKGQLQCKIEFDTKEAGNVGTEQLVDFSIAGDKMNVSGKDGMKRVLTRLDDGNGELAGTWRITGRMVEGKINEMPRRDRKTLKILSGTRFQWMAINPATKEFFGTGGGTYTFANGKYTEQVDFFSRDSSRVGAILSFEGTVKGDVWNHSGKSSKGDPLNEIWTKEKN